MDERTKERKKKDLLSALAVAGGYALIYLAGRILQAAETPVDVSYLYGWLLHQGLFWAALAVSTVPALFGKRYFALTSLFGFAAALLLGELCGHNPAGAAFGQGHFGWAVWGGIFLLSVVMGIVLERIAKGKLDLRSKKFRLWAAALALGMLAVVLLVRAGMPTGFHL